MNGQTAVHGIILLNADSHGESEAAPHDSSAENNCQRPGLYQIAGRQMEKAKIRRSICSGLRCVL